MEPGTQDFIAAREMVSSLLEQLGLDAYLFEVERRGDWWEVRVECARDDGWQSSVLSVEPAILHACRTDAAVRNRLLGEWRHCLTSFGGV